METILPRIFTDLLEQPVNELVDRAQQQGRRVIGVTCSYVPEPLLNVDGLASVRVRAPGTAGTPMADTYLSSVICTYTRSILECALEGAYDSLDGWVFSGSCDHLRRLFDNFEYLVKPDFIHILDLPHKTGKHALDWFMEEVRKMAGAITRHFRVDTDEYAIKKAIRQHNRGLALLRDIGELRKREQPPISGTDFHTLVTACAAAPRHLLLDELEKVRDTAMARDGIQDFRARLLLAGSTLDDPEYIRVIESQGGLVVGERCCTGSIPGLEPVPETDDPLRDMCAHYLRRTSCPRMMEEFEARVEDIVSAAKQTGAHGVVLQTMKFCDCWGVECSPLVEALRDAGLPVLRLEREYAMSGEGQLRTRVQAFLESMGR